MSRGSNPSSHVAAFGEIVARGDDGLDEQDRLGHERLAARERHEIVDDAVCDARMLLDLRDVRLRRRGLSPVDVETSQVCAR